MAKRFEISKMILSVVAVLGLVVVSAALPGAVMALAPFMKNSRGKYSPKQIRRSLEGAKKQGLISISYEAGKTVIKLTKNGKQKLLKYKFEDMRVKPQGKWDGKWRLVIFDIPESLKISRQMFRRKIKEIGFQRLQKSVWVCPYPCEDEIDFLKEIYKIRSYVRIVTADSIDIQNDLLKKFNLSH